MEEKDILNSWKEISNYLDRNIRTVIRWEKELGLPIHKIDRGTEQLKIFAYKSEIDEWLKEKATSRTTSSIFPRRSIVSLIIVIFSLLLSIATVSGLYKYFDVGKIEDDSTKIKESYRETLFKYFDKKFELGLMNSKDDIEIIKRTIEREHGKIYSLAPLLEDYLKYLIDPNSKAEDKNIKAKYDFIVKIVNKEKEEKPFVGVPKEERRLFITINNSIDLEDKISAKQSTKELSSLISAKNKIYLKAQKINKWALPIAIIGVIVSIFFGTLNIMNRVDLSKFERKLKKIIKEQMMARK